MQAIVPSTYIGVNIGWQSGTSCARGLRRHRDRTGCIRSKTAANLLTIPHDDEGEAASDGRIVWSMRSARFGPDDDPGKSSKNGGSVGV